MKLALVTTPLSVRSGIGDYTRHLLPSLRERCDVELFVESGADTSWPGEKVRTVDQLRPRDFDQILYQLGNESNHAFMAHMIRAIGGAVMQHDWVLFDLAMTAHPGLVRGGVKGHALAAREGGLQQAQLYAKNWLDRRRQRKDPVPFVNPDTVPGRILFGWHEPEPNGRWTSDMAAIRIPASDVEQIEIDCHTEPGCTLRIVQGAHVLYEGIGGVHQLDPVDFERPVLTIETAGIRVSSEQRKHGDSRRLGCCVRRIAWRAADGVSEMDLSEPCTYADTPVSLSRDRFLLPFNRSVVRFADAFIVHSEYVRQRILRERNSATPVGVLHHGAENRCRSDTREETRTELGLDATWRDSFLVTSFGGVQAHKRIDKALSALALARKERDDIRLVLAGSINSSEFDPLSMAKGLGLEDAVKFTGFVPEETGWDWLHAGDIALNLRGPSSGGTSGGIFQAFSIGRPVIASDAAEQCELPDSCVVKIPLGEDEVPALARALIELRDRPERREELEGGVRKFVDEECHWNIVGQQYVDYLESFPVPRVSRRKLISLRLGMISRNTAAESAKGRQSS